MIPVSLHPMVETTLAAPDVVTNVPTLAAALRVHRKTLFNRCEREDFIAPAELVAWARLALVAYLLETTGYSIETIAIELSYPSDTSLRNAIKRYTGQRASEIREGGGVETVVSRTEPPTRGRKPAPRRTSLVTHGPPWRRHNARMQIAPRHA